ncbi:peptidoglycan-recognition protein SB1-like [Calliphora vicina]|uniref:peptidoglycan-recognition protein SB1-like n=1 Tax=Calliphora vicina TaxID=7373 RepID=UPI00325B98B9
MVNLLKTIALLAIALPACLCVTIKPRSSWGATPALSDTHIDGAVDNVFLYHLNNSYNCSNEFACQTRIKYIQTDHMAHRNFSDIAYNFLIAGDGNIYEGRGWGVQGTHNPNYNNKSISIAFLGNLENSKPSNEMVQNAKDLIALAVSDGYLKENYIIRARFNE